ncbi:putative ankyrin repeat protein RF_0381 [Cloeon dipterum]|uniref:putative ankyrin repeat protein RF_0381 n=1 Tax=Cloeon dipterum TaxID=197152 RepID=UPI00321F84EB
MTGPGATSLHLAALNSDLKAVSKLVSKKGKATDATASSGESLLHFAACNKIHGREIVEYLLSTDLKGIDVRHKDINGAEPIHYAIFEVNLEVAQELLKKRGADLELLHLCITSKKLEFAKLIHVFDNELINCLDPEGNSALHLAAEFSDLETCQWLIGEGVKVDTYGVSSGDSVLHCAARNQTHGWEILHYLKPFILSELNINGRNNSDETPLHAALKTENIRAAEELKKLDADLKVELDGENPLEFCVTQNKLQSAKFIVKHDRQQIKDENGCRCTIHLAAEKTDKTFCKWLINEEKVDLFRTDNKHRNVLHYAILNETHGKQLIRLFLKNKNSVKSEQWPKLMNDSRNPVLGVALKAENIIIVKELLRYGAKLEENNLLHFCVLHNALESAKFVHEKYPKMLKERNQEGLTVFQSAVAHADVKMCKWLTELGLGKEPTENTALHYVSKNEKFGKEVTAYLYAIGLDVNATNKFEETPLYRALLTYENFDVAETLMQFGANLKEQVGNENILLSCIRMQRHDCAKFVLEKDQDLIRQAGARGETVLHFAAEKSELETCQWLVDKGADPKALSETGSSVVHFAASNKVGQGRNLVWYFHSLGLDINGTNNKKVTPLHCAIIKGNYDVVDELCRLDADLTVKIDGENLLHFCARHKRLKMAKLLLSKDRQLIKGVDSFGNSAHHVAKKVGDLEFCKWLVEQGVKVGNDAKDVPALLPKPERLV